MPVKCSVFRLPVAFFMVGVVLGQSATKALLSACNWSVNETELSYVIFVNHREDRSALDHVNFGVLHVGRVLALEFSVAIVRNDALSLLLGTTVICLQGCGDASRGQATDVCFFGAALKESNSELLQFSSQGTPGEAAWR